MQAAPTYKLRLEREAIADAREEREERKDRCAIALGFPIFDSCIGTVCATKDGCTKWEGVIIAKHQAEGHVLCIPGLETGR